MHLIALLVMSLAVPAAFAQDTFTGVERIVAVGDVHGDFGAFVDVLRDAGVIDAKTQKWIGGKTHLVQTGDVLDRGPDSRKVMDLIQSLEKQAPKAGGRVHALMGNHEVMNMYGDLRYVIPAEFAAFKTSDSAQRREDFWEQEQRARGTRATKEERLQWEAQHPLGWVEHRMQFGTDGAYGKWIRAKNMVVKLNDTLFLHGGISAKYAGMSVSQLNEAARNELKDLSKLRPDRSLVLDPEGPLWYRGLAQDPEPDMAPLLQKLLQTHGVNRIVLGHTPTPGAVLPRLGNQVLLIDTGLSTYYGGHRACLIINKEGLAAMHRGQAIPLPPPNAADYVAYLKRAAALEAPTSLLAKFAAQVEAQLLAPR